MFEIIGYKYLNGLWLQQHRLGSTAHFSGKQLVMLIGDWM